MRYARSIAIVLAIFSFATIASAQQKFDATAGWNYSYSDQGGGRANLNGWMGQLSYSTTSNLAFVFEADNYYGRYRGSSVNQHNYVVGPQYTFGSSDQKVRPLVYAEVGMQRSSSSGSVNRGPNVQLGGGASVQLSDRVALQLIPVEWSIARVGGSTLNSYDAKVGITFTLWKKQ